jgi:hypothetical protein
MSFESDFCVLIEHLTCEINFKLFGHQWIQKMCSLQECPSHQLERILWQTLETCCDEKDPNVRSQLIYMVSHPSESAAKTAWEAFVNDPKWKQVSEDSQKDGKIIEKLESIFMSPTSFSTIR